MTLCEICPYSIHFDKDKDGNTTGILCSKVGHFTYDITGHIAECKWYPTSKKTIPYIPIVIPEPVIPIVYPIYPVPYYEPNTTPYPFWFKNGEIIVTC